MVGKLLEVDVGRPGPGSLLTPIGAITVTHEEEIMDEKSMWVTQNLKNKYISSRWQKTQSKAAFWHAGQRNVRGQKLHNLKASWMGLKTQIFLIFKEHWCTKPSSFHII